MPAPPRFGTESTISAQNVNSQSTPAIARAADGRIAVAWQDVGANAGDIKFRILNSSGSPSTNELTANASTTGQQGEPEVAFLADGKLVVVWTDFAAAGGDIRFQLFNPNGSPVLGADGIVGGSSTGLQQQPAIASRPDGSFVISWYEGNAANIGTLSGGSAAAVMAQAFSSSGVALAAPVRISGDWGGDFAPAVAASGTDLVFAWDDSGGPQNGRNGEDGLYLRTITGALPTAPGLNGGVRVDGNAGFRESSEWPDLAIGNLGTLVVWQDAGIAGADGLDVYGRIIAANGTQGSVFKLNTTTSSSQERPAVTALPQGGYVVVWQSFSSASAYDIMARIIDAAGGLQDEFLVTSGSFTTGSQISPDVQSLLDGRFIVSWSTGTDGARGIEVQIFDPRSAPINWVGDDDPLGAPTGRSEQFWGTDLANAGDTLLGAFGDDTLYGQAGPDILRGGENNDALDGGDGNDQLFGDVLPGEDANAIYSGNDTLLGGDGNDFLSGGLGRNLIDGGPGVDTVSYDIDVASIDPQSAFQVLSSTIDLAAGTARMLARVTDPFGAQSDITVFDDALTGVENVVGSAFADRIIGNDGPNRIDAGGGADTVTGGLGNDTLIGGGAADLLDGGTGVDEASYAADTQPVAANLFGGFAVQNSGQPGALVDTLIGIENITGGGGDDFLIGDNIANRLEGLGGADNLWGYGGNDTLIGGDGSDIIVGGDNDDSLESGIGQDWLYGQGGADTLRATDATANAFNVLVGGDGNDTLIGGPTGFDYFYGGDGATAGGNDTFVIFSNSGIKVMNDFEAGGVNDVVRLTGTPLASFSQVQASLSFSATINGAVLVVDGGTQVWFLGLQPNQLTAADFLFA